MNIGYYCNNFKQGEIMPKKEESYADKVKNMLFKPRPGTIAGEANKEQKGMSEGAKRKVKEFTDSFGKKKK